jgi:hypothetical protein
MGRYINPENETKEDFLEREGKEISIEEAFSQPFDKNNLLCILMDNTRFTAALICYCEEELAYIKRLSNDERHKKYYIVPRKKLKKFINEKEGVDLSIKNYDKAWVYLFGSLFAYLWSDSVREKYTEFNLFLILISIISLIIGVYFYVKQYRE